MRGIAVYSLDRRRFLKKQEIETLDHIRYGLVKRLKLLGLRAYLKFSSELKEDRNVQIRVEIPVQLTDISMFFDIVEELFSYSIGATYVTSLDSPYWMFRFSTDVDTAKRWQAPVYFIKENELLTINEAIDQALLDLLAGVNE